MYLGHANQADTDYYLHLVPEFFPIFRDNQEKCPKISFRRWIMKFINDSFFKYVRNFLTVYLPRNKCYSTNTVKAYRDTINLLRIFLSEQKKNSFYQDNFQHD